MFFNPLKTKCVLQYIYKNSVRTSQETRYVTTTNPNLLILFREQSLFTVRTIRNTRIHYVRRMGCCSVLKHVENVITTRSKGLKHLDSRRWYRTNFQVFPFPEFLCTFRISNNETATVVNEIRQDYLCSDLERNIRCDRVQV
jgi:hypothetical protein